MKIQKLMVLRIFFVFVFVGHMLYSTAVTMGYTGLQLREQQELKTMFTTTSTSITSSNCFYAHFINFYKWIFVND